jgi:type I restriction enzyme S subunit
VDFEFSDANGKPYRSSGGEMQESELGMIPKGWRVGKIGDIYETTSGGTPSRAIDGYYEDGKIMWVKSKELNNSFILETEEKINDIGLKNSSAKLLPAKSVLIALYGATVGQTGILSDVATSNQAICALLPNNEYPYTFIFQFLKMNQTNILNFAVGSAQQNISQIFIKEFPIIIPPLDVLNLYSLHVNNLFNKIENNLKQNRTLSQLRDGLLPKLMSGKVRVK